MTTERQMQRRVAEIEQKLEARRTTSEIQADFAIASDQRESIVEERPDEELTSSEIQARALAGRAGRGRRTGHGWREF